MDHLVKYNLEGDMEKDKAPEIEKMEFPEDENTVRGNWTNKLDFILTLIGYSVGLGNICRFPYLCYRNGGGAFLIPYVTMLVLAGIPLYYMELLIGQYSSLGPIAVWKLSPIFAGVGISAVVVTFVICLYYTTLLAYVFFYLFASMTSELPWLHCGNPWNSPACRERNRTDVWIAGNQSSMLNMSDTWEYQLSTNGNSSVQSFIKPKSPAEEYFERYVLDLSTGIGDVGEVRWQLALCLLLAWILIFLVLIKGIKSAGKVVYFTATFPYVVLIILLVRGLTLEGSQSGLYYYIVPEWSKLLEPKVWGDAAAQIFYSLGPCWGALIAFASYNKFNNNCLRDTVVCSVICCGTSVLAGTVIFSVIGFVAHDLNLPIKDVMTSGPGLAFVAYPEALARMPIGPFWSVIFFLMLLTAGIDTMFSQIEMLTVAISDEFPNKLRNHKTLFTLAMCVGFFLIGLPQVTRGGMYLFNLIDWYIALFSVLIIGLLEVLVITYVYGFRTLSQDAYIMLGKKPNVYFIACWCFFTPAIIMAICIFNALQHKPAVYNDYTYPPSALVLGWLIAFTPLLPIPIYMIYATVKHQLDNKGKKPSLWTTLRELCKPAADWGPMMAENRQKAGLPVLKETMEPLYKLPTSV